MWDWSREPKSPTHPCASVHIRGQNVCLFVRLIFINRFYWPEEPATAQLLADLAVALAGMGHRVAVVTSRPGNGAGMVRETAGGVEIHRVPMSRLGRSSLAARAVDFATFLRHARSRLLQIVQPGD